MSVNAIGKVVIGLAVLVVGYGASRLFFQTANHPVVSNQSITSQPTPSCTDVREVQALMGKVEKATDLQSPYSISIPLLGAAYLKDKHLYEKWKEALFQAFKI